MLLQMNKKLFNDIHIGIGFLFLFTSFLTFSSIQQTLSVSIARDNPHYHADGYICAGILNAVFAFSSWLTPSIIALFGWKITLVTGSFLYLPFVTGDYFETDWVAYTSAVVTGIGAALIWNSQATYIVLNSEIQNTYQGITSFWIIYQFSSYGGNLFIFYLFGNSEEFANRDIRGKIYIFVGSLVVCSMILFSFLRRPIRENRTEKKQTNALKETKKAITIGLSKKIFVSNIIFLSMGLSVAFCGVSAASLGFTRYLSDNSKKYAPLTGILQGIGEIIGCVLGFCMKGKPMFNISKLRLAPIGCIVNMAAYAIIFIGLPDSAALSFTDEEPFIELPLVCFLVADIFFGMGDACLHIEAYSFLGQLYPSDSPPAFAVFKFTRGIGICIGFYLGRFLGLHIQTGILFIFSFLAIIVHYYNWQSPEPVSVK